MNLKNILNAFPTPKFLAIPFGGVSISDSSIKCIKFAKKNGSLLVDKFIEKKIPKGAVIDGQINKPEEIIELLKGIKRDLKLTHIKMSLPEEKAYLFTAKIPVVSEKEIRSAVESKIEENVPVSPSELAFDFMVFKREEGDFLDVVVSALPLILINSYVEIAEKSELSLLGLEIESQAITRAIVPPGEQNTVLIINFSSDSVGLYVSSSRIVRFTSTIATRGESANNPAFLMQEIKRLYTYWHTLKENVDKPNKKISQIYVCGEDFDDTMILYISSHTKTPTSIANVWINAFDINKSIPEISFNDSLKYAGAIGLALPTKTLI